MDKFLKKYAKLILNKGLNIQKDQIVVISAPIDSIEFVRIIVEVAYKEGAKNVVFNWYDDILSKLWYQNASDEVLGDFPNWKKEFYLSYVKQGAGFISICSEDPEALKDIDPNKIAKAQKPMYEALKEYMDSIMSDKNSWCVASIPCKAWANKVFPNCDDAEEKLWKVIFDTVRINDGDPIEQWNIHINNLKQRIKKLNNYNFKSLHYKNSLGTDVIVELPDKHRWVCGSEKTQSGIEFIANIPTEEVFTLPKKTGVNGTIVGSMPLNYNGNIIDKFKLILKDGKIIDYSAEQGYETLMTLIETDEGSRYLGEVALVPFDSPISNLNIMFYNTLFDENASCHFAIGKAYPTNLENGNQLSTDELIAAGANDSITHVDFMIGTSDLEIIGTTQDNIEIIVFENGNFKI